MTFMLSFSTIGDTGVEGRLTFGVDTTNCLIQLTEIRMQHYSYKSPQYKIHSATKAVRPQAYAGLDSAKTEPNCNKRSILHPGHLPLLSFYLFFCVLFWGRAYRLQGEKGWWGRCQSCHSQEITKQAVVNFVSIAKLMRSSHVD